MTRVVDSQRGLVSDPDRRQSAGPADPHRPRIESGEPGSGDGRPSWSDLDA